MERQTEGDTEVQGWVAELQRGENVEANSRRIFGRYYGWVRKFFTRRGLSLERAEELTQETFLQTFRKIESFLGGGRFDSWLFAIAANRLRNERRGLLRQKRDAPEISLNAELSPSGGFPEVTNGTESPERSALEKERLSAVLQAIEQLPAKQRECLQLRLSGCGYAKIGEILKLSASTARVHVHAARKRLREELEEELRDWI